MAAPLLGRSAPGLIGEAVLVESRRASRTALGSAYQRAAHLVHDPPPWILEDRFARAIVGEAFYEASEAVMATWSPDLFAAFRAHFTVRARLAEDVAVDALDDERTDYVVLGAGADTFAWRHPDAAAFTIWEIDHPVRRPGSVRPSHGWVSCNR